MSHDKIGPKERMLREQREARAKAAEEATRQAAEALKKRLAAPVADLRDKIAAIKPKPKKAKKGKKR